MCDGRFWCGGKADFVAAEDPSPTWAGHRFGSGPVGGMVAGVYVWARRDGARVHAVHVGEGEDLARASLMRAGHGLSRLEADRFYWMAEDDPRRRADIVRRLVERYAPPGNAVDGPSLGRPAAAPEPPPTRH